MNDGVPGNAPGTARTRTLAIVCVGAWLAAAASAGLIGIWTAMGGTAVALGLAVLAFGDRPSTVIGRPSMAQVVLGITAGVVMAVATGLLYPVFARLIPGLATDAARLYAEFQTPSLVVACLALVPVIVAEELVWRGVVQEALVQRKGVWMGVALTALVYALVHLPIGSPVLVAVALVCGLAWGVLRAVSASLVPALLSHLVWDVLVLLWQPVHP